MPLLAIETATAACSAALLEGGTVLARRHEHVGRGHAERLVPMIGELLAEAGLARADAVLVDCGPGSFTGIRVGLAAARALGLAWRVPVRGFSSLAALALASGEARVAVAISGGHGELFVQRFEDAIPRGPVRSLAPEAAASEVIEAVVVGSGAAALVGERGWGEARGILPDAADAALLPASLADLPPSPLYGRAPDAKLPA